jgi:hypothetical protein
MHNHDRAFRATVGRYGVGGCLSHPYGRLGRKAHRWMSSGQFLRRAKDVALALLAATEERTPEWAGALIIPSISVGTEAEQLP